MPTTTLERLRSQLLTSLGLAIPSVMTACGSAVPSADEAGVTTDPSSSGSSSDDANDELGDDSSSDDSDPTTTSTSTDDETDSEGEADDLPEPKLDLPSEPDLPPLGDCTTTLSDSSILAQHPDCPIVPDEGNCWNDIYLGCVDLEEGQTCESLCPEGDCIADWTNCMGDPVWEPPANVCGPYEINGQCCSIAEGSLVCGSDGRPFVVDGAPRHATLERIARAPRTDDEPRFADLSPALREHLAAHWARVAAAEHASIASFAQLASRLLAIAAPPELIRDALAAAADEARHAEAALALASKLVGGPLGFAALDVRGAGATQDLEAMLLACVREGCIGETIAALEIATAAAHCEDPKLAALLRSIADDEARHAGLAWRFVQWALGQQPELRTKVLDVFASLHVREQEAECLDAEQRRLLRAHGCLPADERRRVELDGLQQLIWPCATALLSKSMRRAPTHRAGSASPIG